MGHQADRSRGDSRIRDWPDVEWRLVRASDDPASERFITAYGRDVNVPESQVVFDQSSRHLTLLQGSRKAANALKALPVIKDWLRTADEASKGDIEKAMESRGIGRQVVRDALSLGESAGLSFRKGARGAGGSASMLFFDNITSQDEEINAPLLPISKSFTRSGCVRIAAEKRVCVGPAARNSA